MPVVMEEKDPTPVPPELPSDPAEKPEEVALDDSSSYIPLQRVVVTMQYSKQNNAMVLMEGWMVHYTNRNPVVRAGGSPYAPKYSSHCFDGLAFNVRQMVYA